MKDPEDVDMWFYVPRYPAVRAKLENAYKRFDVEEWSAEPGRVRDCPDDADVTVRGTDENVAKFWNWLIDSKIDGLRMEGEKIR